MAAHSSLSGNPCWRVPTHVARQAEVGNLATRQTPTAGPDDPPDVDLMAEHGVLKRVLLIYQAAVRRTNAGMAPPASAIHDGAEVIHDFIESFHEALEEGYVFPRLRTAGKLVGTVDTLLVQHARGRELTQLILAGSTARAMSSTTTRKSVTGSHNCLRPHVRASRSPRGHSRVPGVPCPPQR
jgi:hypothetical protein